MRTRVLRLPEEKPTSHDMKLLRDNIDKWLDDMSSKEPIKGMYEELRRLLVTRWVSKHIFPLSMYQNIMRLQAFQFQRYCYPLLHLNSFLFCLLYGPIII